MTSDADAFVDRLLAEVKRRDAAGLRRLMELATLIYARTEKELQQRFPADFAAYLKELDDDD